MKWSAVLLLCLLVPCARPARAKDEPSEPLWRRCYTAIDWHVNAEVPDTEKTMLDQVMKGQLAVFSKAWVRKAIAEAGGLTSALERARKEKKLVLWYVPHIEGQHMILPHLLDRYMMVGPLSHSDVTTLVTRRFVAVKLPAGGELGKKYGLVAPAAIEPALLVLSPEGKVLSKTDRISVFDPAYVRSLLVEALARPEVVCAHHGMYIATQKLLAERNNNPRRQDFIKQCLNDGEDAEAEALLDSTGGATAHLSYLDLARYRRTSVQAARDKLGDKLKLWHCGLSWAMLLLQQGQPKEALLRLLELPPELSEKAIVRYHVGLAHYLMRDEEKAREVWKDVVANDDGSMWASKSDAYVRQGSDKAHGEGPLTRGMLYLHGPPPNGTWQERVRAAGVDFLLQAQRSDGSWDGPRWGAGKDSEDKQGQTGFHNIKTAISALCCTALQATVASGRTRDIERALERGEKFLLRDGLVERGDAIVWTYADAFRLRHFSKRLPSLSRDRAKRVRRKMETWIRHLVEHQKANDGCFRHYVYRSTFVTACVTYCLWHAKEAGFEVPPSVFDDAAQAIEGARGGDRGLYGYLLDRPAATRTIRGASGRQPLCEWTLFLLGKRKIEDLHQSLEIFDEGYEFLERARKGNFHVPSLDSTAGYYFFHDFYPACEAARASGKHASRHTRALLDKLRALQEPDGTFLDCGFSYGKCYSTAMALLSLEALTRPTKPR